MREQDVWGKGVPQRARLRAALRLDAAWPVRPARRPALERNERGGEGGEEVRAGQGQGGSCGVPRAREDLGFYPEGRTWEPCATVG